MKKLWNYFKVWATINSTVFQNTTNLRLVYIMTLGFATKFRNCFLFHCACVNCSGNTELRHYQVLAASNFQETKVVVLTFWGIVSLKSVKTVHQNEGGGDEEIIKFLYLYAVRTCLWDYNDANFKNKVKRAAALEFYFKWTKYRWDDCWRTQE